MIPVSRLTAAITIVVSQKRPPPISILSLPSQRTVGLTVARLLCRSEWIWFFEVHRSSVIPDDEKKFFCENTMWAWHGEFARLILATALINDFDIRLLPDHARSAFSNLYFSMVQHENAKAQFQCDLCGYCWTSMRARCSFYVTAPNPIVLVFFKLYTQQCQYCYSIVSPLWYFGESDGTGCSKSLHIGRFSLDEICRVMKHLAEAIHRDFFPNSLELIQWDLEHDGTRYVRRFYQRKGQMHAQHNQSLCEACQFHLCYT